VGGVPNLATEVSTGTVPGGSTIGTVGAGAQPAGTVLAGINAANLATPASTSNPGGPTAVASIDVTSTTGANSAMETIDVALATIDNIQATLGAAQNRFTGIATSQQAESTDLSSAQSEITDADFAQETANLSKAQVLQQAGISVLAQANSQAQQVLKLLQ
ncbi:MAG TPA: flagellin, partial [Paraburkholderia sp.]|nr:flagellin [Paraburkholderia sp.]